MAVSHISPDVAWEKGVCNNEQLCPTLAGTACKPLEKGLYINEQLRPTLALSHISSDSVRSLGKGLCSNEQLCPTLALSHISSVPH